MNDSQYITFLAEAYQKGYKLRSGSDDAPKLHYFKTKEDLPRVQQVLGFLWGVIPAGQVKTLLAENPEPLYIGLGFSVL